MSSPRPVQVAALYIFVPLDDVPALQAQLSALCAQHQLRGTVLLAAEGMNGTVAGTEAGIRALRGFLDADPRLAPCTWKTSWADAMPFWRMKVRLKKEIVTMGVPGTDPAQLNGQRVRGAEWNQLLDDPEVLVIDTRNQYEVDVGTFPGAVSPQTDTFRDFPDYVRNNLDPQQHKKVAMFCTGGIRCEKATNYLLREGFAEVYHLDGGILQYLEDVPTADNRWEGECFVFDGRVSVDKALQPGVHTQCHACRHPLTPEQRADPRFVEGVQCPHCVDRLTPEQKARAAERHRQVTLAAQRGRAHLGEPQADGSSPSS
ncbi:MAG: rhodanese-related sulfurtransferase [Oceanococcaceae bacterium]